MIIRIRHRLVVTPLRHRGNHRIVHYIFSRARQVGLAQLPNQTCIALVSDQYIAGILLVDT